MLGMSYQESTYDYITSAYNANGADAITNRDPSFWYLSYGDPSASKSIQGEKTRTAKYSYFGRVGYDFAGKYMLQASLRADAADLSYLPLENAGDTSLLYLPDGPFLKKISLLH